MASGDSITDSSDSSVDVNNAVSAKIKGTDEENDLAVIAVEKSDIPEETMNEIKIAQMGSSDDLVAVSYTHLRDRGSNPCFMWLVVCPERHSL